jgi:hypothetical protein
MEKYYQMEGKENMIAVYENDNFNIDTYGTQAGVYLTATVILL